MRSPPLLAAVWQETAGRGEPGSHCRTKLTSMRAPLSHLNHLLTRSLVFAHLPVSRGFPSADRSVLGCGGLRGLWKTGKEIKPARWLAPCAFASPLAPATGQNYLVLNSWFRAVLTRSKRTQSLTNDLFSKSVQCTFIEPGCLSLVCGFQDLPKLHTCGFCSWQFQCGALCCLIVNDQISQREKFLFPNWIPEPVVLPPTSRS